MVMPDAAQAYFQLDVKGVNALGGCVSRSGVYIDYRPILMP